MVLPFQGFLVAVIICYTNGEVSAGICPEGDTGRRKGTCQKLKVQNSRSLEKEAAKKRGHSSSIRVPSRKEGTTPRRAPEMGSHAQAQQKSPEFGEGDGMTCWQHDMGMPGCKASIRSTSHK